MGSEHSTASSYKWVVLFVSSIATFMSSFDGSVVNLALPTISNALRASFGYVIWIPTVYLLVKASLQTSIGRLGDTMGGRRLFMAGSGLFTLGSVLASLSTDISQMIAGRIVQGVGAATMDVTGLAIVVDTFPGTERGKAIGINNAAVYSGLTVGPVVGGFLVQAVGWRSIFYVNVPIGVLTVILIAVRFRKETAVRAQRFDPLGALSLTVFLTSLLLILSQNDLALSPNLSTALYVVFIASLLAFIIIEQRVAASPLLDLKLFTQNRLFAAGNFAALMEYMTSGGSLLILSFYLQLSLGYSPISAGLVLLAQPVVMVLSALLSGTLSDRVSARLLSSAGMFTRSVGLFLLSLLGANSQPQDVWVPLVLMGVGHGFFSSPNINSVMSSVPSSKFGLTSGMLATIRTGGQSIGIAIFGAIVAANMPPGTFSALASGVISKELAEPFIVGMRVAFLFASVTSCIGGFASLMRGKKAVDGD